MHPYVATSLREHALEVAALCKDCGVARLDLFGSATGAQWRPGESDLDLLVRFHVPSRRGIADDYLRLADGLESLFGCRVDLLTESAVKNPFLRQTIKAHREPIYAD